MIIFIVLIISALVAGYIFSVDKTRIYYSNSLFHSMCTYYFSCEKLKKHP